MVQQRRRISYVIPSPAEPAPRLQLPPHGISRLGLTGPLLIPLRNSAEVEIQKSNKYPRHRLGISSLALDTSTQLSGRAAPEGILYSAGRDGLVISWDLGIPMKKRKPKQEDSVKRRDWELMTGWADEEDIEDTVQSDGDILGDVTMSPRRRQKVNSQVIPLEKQWETDLAAYKPGKQSEFRQSVQINSDWVNDILLCNNQQTVISASSDGTVKAWSPHMANSPTGKRTGKLVGHTDNIRAILMSEDAKYLLTGSADASIKLWSLATQRCLHTFTHHTESVWSLHSSHPTLEVFYSGDRSGLVCKVDVEDCSDVSEGECVLLCQDADPCAPSSDGINQIIAMDDNLLWTASGHSNIKRWSVPQRRSVRASNVLLDFDGDRYVRSDSPFSSESSTRPSTAGGSLAASTQSLSADTWPPSSDRDDDTRLYGIPFESLIRLISPNEAFAYTSGRTRDPEVATLYSAASIKSVPRQAMRSPTMATFKSIQSPRTEDTVHPVNSARAEYEERELASDAVPLLAEPEDIIAGEHGLVRSIILNDRVHALTVDTSGEVAVWDIVHGVCLGRFFRNDVAAISNAGSWAGGSNGEKEHSPREALEAVRERIEGEAVVSQWATADTKTGVLTIYLSEKCFEAEVYADEVGYLNDRRFNDESKINLGKWVLRNLFLGFIREEHRIRRGSEDGDIPLDGILVSNMSRITRKSSAMFPSSIVVQSPKMIPALPPTAAAPVRSSPLLASFIPLHSKEISLPAIFQSPFSHTNDTPFMSRRHRPATTDEGEPFVGPPPSSGNSVSDYFSGRTRQPSASGQGAATASADDNQNSAQGGIMGRLKNFGKAKRPPSEVSSSPVIGSLVPSSELTSGHEDRSINLDVTQSPTQAILSGPITPPPSSEAPTYTIPPNTLISISEEAAPSYRTVYRGTIASTKHDILALEEAIPLWLMEYLLLNKTPVLSPHQKVSFVLLPWPMPDAVDQLPELLNTTQSKLTSSRYLRVRKLVVHVQEKLGKMSPPSRTESPEEGQESNAQPRPPAEEEFEILCNDVVLHLGMSLAVVRQYVWKQSSELSMYYRRKLPSTTERT
ncbi:hypothetical protein C0991_003122 [Blastosporella zonata]|nr:hypothetical protein C0991_003122 [Blastosporella zonata]